MQQNLIGESTAILALLDEVSDLAPINRPLLILGERGTGKEMIAERVHYLSPRWEQDLIKVNCAAFSEQLLESELFGHEAGSFTGATRQHRGHFERANQGTLFLDELATLSVSAQEKLLRLIEYGEFQRVGGHTTLNTDVRIIAASNGNIVEMAKKGEFRADLLDRLAFDVLNIPPLRERHGDIELLVEHYALKMTQELEREYFSGFDAEALVELNQYHWPGNIRELKNVVERSVARWQNWQEEIAEVRINPFKQEDKKDSDTHNSLVNKKAIQYPLSFSALIEDFTKDTLTRALGDHHYSQKKTAKALGISYDRIRYLIRKYGL